MLINLRNALMAGKRLPYDAEVEYLQSSGTQYIDTGVVADSDTQIVIGMSLQQISAATVSFGAAGMQINIGKNFSRQYFGTTTDAFAHNDIVTDVRFDLDMDAPMKRVVLNGTAKTINWTTAWTCADVFPLFAFVSGGQTYRSCRVYSCKIWQNGVLVRDYIPVRKGAVGYLYDRVSGKLFGNAGTGDFVLGPDVVPVEWLESSGTQYVDTGVTLSTGTQFKVNICPTYSTGDRKYLGSDAANFGLAQLNGKWRLRVYGWSLTSIDVVTDSFTTVEKNTNGWFINGTNVYGDWGPRAAVPFLCFAWLESNNTISTASALCKISHLKITDNGTPVRDFLPVRVGTNATSWEGAMMDVLTRRIYRNAGTGAFTYGNDRKYPIPAE